MVVIPVEYAQWYGIINIYIDISIYRKYKNMYLYIETTKKQKDCKEESNENRMVD